MDAARWIELPRRVADGLVRDLRGLRGNERLAVAGVAAILISLPLPWYSVRVADLVQTGLGDFNFAQGGLLLMCAATVFLALEVGGGYVPPRPLREWGLFVAAGVWMALIVVYLMLDRPALEVNTPLADVESEYGLGYGIFIALGGSLLVIAAGIRMRRPERARRPRAPD